MATAAHEKNEPFFGNLLPFVKPLAPLLPRIRSPLRGLSLREKTIWTFVAVLIYLLLSQVPLFGIISSEGKDPLAWMRMMMASNRGTLMDLGISPVVTASMVAQVIAGIGLVRPDYSIKEDKLLMDSVQKIIALIFTIGQAIVQIASGTYGSPSSLGKPYCLLLLLQLVIAGLIVILLDEMLQKEYGLGNGVNLFIVTSVCERIVWNAISPKVFFTGRGIEFEGCLIASVYLLVARKNKLSALYELMFRQNLPNLFSFLCTLFVFCVVVYIQSLRAEIPIISTKFKGVASFYPVSLLYTSSTPIIIQSYMISHVSTLSRFLYRLYPRSILVRLLGVWEIKQFYGYMPVAGLCYYIYPPTSLSDVLSRPFFFLVYSSVMLLSAGLLCRAWLDSHDDNAESVYRRIKGQEMQLKGVRDASAAAKLNEYIAPAAFLGGVITSSVVILCDIMSTMGSGNNIFLAASIINQYMKLLAKETARRSGKAFIE